MSEDQLFSKFYETDVSRHEDQPKFKNRLLKYLEDYVNVHCVEATYDRCRHEMGIDIEEYKLASKLYIERTFTEKSIKDILDFITIVHDAAEFPDRRRTYIREINRILQEERMCYVLHENGRVRYYPDDEFYQGIKCTLVALSKPKYQNNLMAFNEVLDELYNKRCKESPIVELHKCIESFVLTMIKDKSFKLLNDSAIETLMNKIEEKIKQDNHYTEHDKAAVLNIRSICIKWINMTNKYRHGKEDQQNSNVPKELFYFIFSTGVSIFRFLLEIDDKYKIIPDTIEKKNSLHQPQDA